MSEFRSTSGPKCFGTAPRKSFFDGGDKNIPGPGCNSPQRWDKIDNPEWSIGLSEDRNSFTEPFRAQYPSPQDYKPHFSSTQNNPIEYTIPQAGVDQKSIQLYNHIYHPDIRKVTKQDPIYSFGYSIENNFETQIPGVGSYQLEAHTSDFNKTQHQFGTGERPLPYGEEGRFPGPGKYLKMDLNQTQKYSFPKSMRTISKKQDPPARFYDIGLKSKTPKGNHFIFEAKDKKRQTMLFRHNQNPAPNQYHTLLPHKISCGVIEHSKRRPLQQSDSLKYPSPEKYTGDQILRKTRKGFSFSKNIRDISVTDNLVPPPGSYEQVNTLKTIGGAIGKQKQKVSTNPTPASTDYRPKMTLTKLKAHSTIVFRGNRQDFSKTITGPIGPGTYNSDLVKNPSELGKIGRGERNSLYSPNKNPGVGNYDIPGYFGRLPKYYTSPKKMTENGFSTFHQRLRMKIQQRQRISRREKSEQKQEKSSQNGQQELQN